MTETYFEWLSQASPGVQLQQLMSGHWIAQAIGVAAELGIADLLADGPRWSDDLAKASGCDTGALHRLLRALASLGIFTEVEPQRFGLTPMAEALRADASASVRSRAIQSCSDVQWRAWGQLGYSVRTGQPAFEHIFGMDQWEYRARNPEVNAKFNASETSIVTQVANAVASAYDFSGFGSLIDVGGSHGALLIAILRVTRGCARCCLTNPTWSMVPASHWWQPVCWSAAKSSAETCSRRFLLAAMPIYSRESSMVGMTTALWLFSRTAAA